jgi:hypothetical protein
MGKEKSLDRWIEVVIPMPGKLPGISRRAQGKDY